jgi:SnoaL-like domain
MNKFKGQAYICALLAGVALMLVSFVSLASFVPTASAQEPTSVSALLSRAQIADLLANYYSVFGSGHGGFGSFYAENAVLEVNGIVARGRKSIDDLYKTIPPDHGKINVTFTNLKVAVNGDKATYHLVWTEFISESVTTAPRILEQGSDHGKLVKQNAKWLISCRVVTNDGGMPNDLLKYYKQKDSIRVCE